ncbi:MAG TPA: carbon-nitrogen hydrolase family protein [Pararhizobium sp.]|uniref:carbon-nitrogen hydrolase family protein n=1 Tax=Pararhizobium sp. TaxID=1977563 RepID=UPI002C0181CA|nr:carbon-nitrogen hydrolase family protein [Pararhizobium sp.]HTO31656.1 carbon-nitrogen hydrolase family protein [Pararhizobium sp.]
MITLAALQMKSVPGDVAANLARIEQAVKEAAAKGASLLMTPELGLTGYGAGAIIRDLAEPADGPLVKRLQAMSVATGVAIIAGFAEDAEGTVFNSAVYVDGDAVPVVYRKSNLYGDYERALFTPAQPGTVTFDHRGVRCGMLICYDVEFPENVRRLALAGVDAVLVPTALPAGYSGTFIADHMIQTRAFENQVFVAYINHCGADERFTFAGSSRIAAPDGSLLASAASHGETLMIVTLKPADFDVSKTENTYLNDLRHPV